MLFRSAVAGKLAERLYAAKAEGASAAGAEQPSAKAKDDVVDAEFEEVKKDQK